MDETRHIGFSRIADSEEFREAMKKQHFKNLRNTLLISPVILIVIFIITFFVSNKSGNGLFVAALATAVIFVIFLIIIIKLCITSFLDVNNLENNSLLGEIIKKEKYYTGRISDEGRTRKPVYRIVVETEDGEKHKLNGQQSYKYYSYVEVGDKVCYHPGYVYPLEIYDKDKSKKNICVFCGSPNNIEADECELCKNPMLK